MYICPVCGYNRLEHPPANFTICPSCYTEFGYDDATMSHADLRREWIQNGLRWESSNIVPPPDNWEQLKYEQLRNIGALDYKTTSGTQSSKTVFVDLGEHSTIVELPSARVTILGRDYGISHTVANIMRGVRVAQVSV